jgi:formylmethanofuran dehydrogenase subunit E
MAYSTSEDTRKYRREWERTSQRWKTPKRKLMYRKNRLRRNYGITLEHVESMLKYQDYKCALCGQDVTNKPRVDHNHETGEIRGVLCLLCNTALGRFGDSVSGVLKVIEYLSHPPTRKVFPGGLFGRRSA